MKLQITDAALVASTSMLSHVVWIGAKMVPIAYRVLFRDNTDVDTRLIMPPITRVASDFVVVFIAVICLIGIMTAALTHTRPERRLHILIGGVSAQGLIAWLSAFCFCFESFTGGMCLHHGPHFELPEFFLSAWGGFPVTLLALLLPLAVTACDLNGRRRPNQ